MDAGRGGGSGAATYGPQLTILVPSYNAGTARFSSLNINVFVLPTKQATTWMAGLQFTFL